MTSVLNKKIQNYEVKISLSKNVSSNLDGLEVGLSLEIIREGLIEIIQYLYHKNRIKIFWKSNNRWWDVGQIDKEELIGKISVNF